MTGPTVSSLPDLKDSKPLVDPKHKATLPERQQDSNLEEAPCVGQRISYLLVPWELLRNSKEDGAVPRRDSAADLRKHGQRKSSPAPL